MQTPERFLFPSYHNRIMYKVKFLFFIIEANIVLIITQGHIDKNHSGSNFDRLAFKQMLEDIDTGRIEMFILTIHS